VTVLGIRRGLGGTVSAMRFSWMLAATVLLVFATGVRCKRRFDGDFEFAEEVSF